MTITLKPETEALIQQGLQGGACESVDDFLQQAVRMLSEQEAWLRENRDSVAAAIQEGWESAQRGELLSESEVRTKLSERKKAFLASR